VGKTFVSVPDLRGEVARLQDELNQAKLDRTKSLRRSQLPRTRIQPVRPEIAESEVSEDEQREKLKRDVFRGGMEAVLARKAAENADLYEPVLQELGLAPEAIIQVRSNLVEVHKKAIAAGEPMMELARSRSAHDANMRSLLGEEGYQQYRLFEASKPALRSIRMTHHASGWFDRLREADCDGATQEATTAGALGGHGQGAPRISRISRMTSDVRRRLQRVSVPIRVIRGQNKSDSNQALEPTETRGTVSETAALVSRVSSGLRGSVQRWKSG
jgi:hypothetical protein